MERSRGPRKGWTHNIDTSSESQRIANRTPINEVWHKKYDVDSSSDLTQTDPSSYRQVESSNPTSAGLQWNIGPTKLHSGRGIPLTPGHKNSVFINENRRESTSRDTDIERDDTTIDADNIPTMYKEDEYVRTLSHRIAVLQCAIAMRKDLQLRGWKQGDTNSSDT